MPIIMIETHNRILKRVKRNAMLGYLAMSLFFMIFVGWHWAAMGEIEMIFEAYRQEAVEASMIKDRMSLLDAIRSKPVTIGQAIDVVDAIMDEAPRRGIPVSIILAIITRESEWRPHAVSEKGARGLMQLMPAIWRLYGVGPDIHNPATNVRAAIAYLGDLRLKHTNWEEVLGVYYSGHPTSSVSKHYVKAVMTKAQAYENR